MKVNPADTTSVSVIEPLLSLPTTWGILGVSRPTFDRIVESGELTVVQVSPGRRLVDPADLRDYIARRKLRLSDLQNDDDPPGSGSTVQAHGVGSADREPA